jgi:FKBP-type peptidyl-prolyl cis-trans isomerase FkpA
MIKSFTYFFILILIVLSCRQEKKPIVEEKSKWSKGHSVNFNQELVIREQMQIKLFLDHQKSLKMKLTNSGLRYMIYKNGVSEELAKNGQLATIKIKMSLLDGTICYETIDNEYEYFGIEKSEKEFGIHELVKYMKVGDRAKAILPSHLAHGLLGDRQNIPPQSILYLDVELIDLKK